MKRACARLVTWLVRWQPTWVGSYLAHSGVWGAALAVLYWAV